MNGVKEKLEADAKMRWEKKLDRIIGYFLPLRALILIFIGAMTTALIGGDNRSPECLYVLSLFLVGGLIVFLFSQPIENALMGDLGGPSGE
jgi:hypothetical protein